MHPGNVTDDCRERDPFIERRWGTPCSMTGFQESTGVPRGCGWKVGKVYSWRPARDRCVGAAHSRRPHCGVRYSTHFRRSIQLNRDGGSTRDKRPFGYEPGRKMFEDEREQSLRRLTESGA